jgi:hypothetical protein
MAEWIKKKDSKYAQKDGTLQLKGYGVMKSEFQRLSAYIRDVLNKNVLYLFHSEEKTNGDDVTVRLQAEGAAKNLVWQPCDFGGYMEVSRDARTIDFTPTTAHFGKGCHGIHGVWKIPELEPGDKNDFVARLFEKARVNIESENAANAGAKTAYKAVMERGGEIIDAVADADTANAARDALMKLEHALTSQKELAAALQRAAKKAGLVYDKIAGTYAPKAEPEKGEDKAS